jgi:hypothetical protein
MSQSRHVKVMSLKQRRANRRNAQRSTGPRTDAGKAHSAQNAVDHGIFCKDLLMPGEDPAEFAAFRDELLKALGPRDALELSIAEQYVEARWRMRRVRAAERGAHELLASDLEVAKGGPFGELRERMRQLPRVESMSDRDRERHMRTNDPDERGRLREQRYADRRALVPVGTTMASSFAQGDGSFERLGRYQSRLELSADRALRQLRQLRKERGPDWTPPDAGAGVRTSVRMSEPEAPDASPSDGPEPEAPDASPSDGPESEAPNAPVQNEPISAPAPASHGASEGCDDSPCNGARMMTPEIFHPAPIALPKAGVAEATPPLEEERS